MKLERLVLAGCVSVAWAAVAHAAPAMIVRETMWQPMDEKLASAVSHLSVNDVLALRAVEVRVREPLAPGENVSLQCAAASEGVTMFPPKELDDPRALVFAVVFPDDPTRAADASLRELGELRCIAGRDAGDPTVTAQGILRDGSRIDLPVSYVRSASHQPAATSGPTGLLLAPNPTTGSMDVRYRVEAQGRVEIAVFDLGGRKIRSLFSGVQEAGERSVHWDGRDDLQHVVPLGVYLLKAQLGAHAATQRLILMR
jgi:flagellar hook capping protein FlgD